MEAVDYEKLDREELISILKEVKGEKVKDDPNKIKYPNDVLPHVKNLRRKTQENFTVLLLDGGHNLIAFRKITTGLVNRTIVHPREVFRPAVQKNSVAIIAVHNHPSGNVQPSEEDKEITKRLKEAGDVLGIQLLDHVIVTKEGYYSFVENMLI